MLVDTSVWIDFFNGHESKQVERLACAIAESESIAVPGVVLTEILLGLKHDAEADAPHNCWAIVAATIGADARKRLNKEL